MIPLTAMVSYRHPHRPASLLLRDELTLRGFSVVHDQSTFLSGNHVAVEMETAVATLDALVAYITPDYLYPGTSGGTPRPALDAEFIPAIRRFREAAASAAAAGADPRSGRPVVYPLVRGFAGTRESMLQDVRHATGYDIRDLWVPDRQHDSADLEQADAAGVARDVLRRLLTPAAGAGTSYDMTFHSRGAGVPAAGLAIDATALLGGELHQVGAPSDWGRLFRALLDLRTALAAHGPSRRIELIARAHLPAALLLGRVFHQAA
ncbi:MAG: toll/interleukin-1 receptor domain-containing protein, partial [Candidatus Dormibacteraeota bacterium]|nr:toll/interleukin-1 receptor domain-containing protein [Candidatus Dormibacteraeota bacterium]